MISPFYNRNRKNNISQNEIFPITNMYPEWEPKPDDVCTSWFNEAIKMEKHQFYERVSITKGEFLHAWFKGKTYYHCENFARSCLHKYSYSDEQEQEGPGIHPPTCTLKCTRPTFVVRLSLHHLDFKRIIPKCVLQNQGEKLRLDGRDAFQQCIQRDGLFTFIPVRKPLHQCADLVSKKRVMCWFHVAR